MDLVAKDYEKTNKNMKKNVVKINENTLRQIVAESMKKMLKEYATNEPVSDYEIPVDVCDWGKKVQELGLELSRLCGKYRYENEELYAILKDIEHEYNAVCGDLNTYDIAPHWES